MQKKNYIIPKKLKEDRNITPGAKVYYSLLSTLVDKDGLLSTPITEIAEMEGVTTATIYSWNRYLEEAGYISSETVATGRGEEVRKVIRLLKI